MESAGCQGREPAGRTANKLVRGGRGSPIGWRGRCRGYRAAAADITAKQIEISLPSSTEEERWMGEEVRDGEGSGDRAAEWL